MGAAEKEEAKHVACKHTGVDRHAAGLPVLDRMSRPYPEGRSGCVPDSPAEQKQWDVIDGVGARRHAGVKNNLNSFTEVL